MTNTAHSFPQFLIPIVLLVLSLIACEEPFTQPKKYGYPRMELPKNHGYSSFSNETCPFTFNYPDYGEITRDMSDSCWVDITFPEYDLTWHFTYRNTLSSKKSRGQHFEEYRRLIYKHSPKASHIEANPLEAPAGKGTLFEIYGEVGTPAQVFLYDEKEEDIMMMSFYFRTATENDSLAPLSAYMKEEVEKMLNTFEWKVE